MVNGGVSLSLAPDLRSMVECLDLCLSSARLKTFDCCQAKIPLLEFLKHLNKEGQGCNLSFFLLRVQFRSKPSRLVRFLRLPKEVASSISGARRDESREQGQWRLIGGGSGLWVARRRC